MNPISAYLRSSIGQKQLMGLSGLGLAVFVLLHMTGNLLLFVGADTYNAYSHKLTSTPLIYVAEAGLIGILLMHVYLAVSLTRRNRAAKPVPTQSASAPEKKTSLVAKTLILSGAMILAFIVLHLITFKYGAHYVASEENGVEVRDIYRLVAEKFSEPAYVGFYVFCLTLLGFHLNHGLSASLQSLGFTSAKNPKIHVGGALIGWLIILGFMSQPLYLFFNKG